MSKRVTAQRILVTGGAKGVGRGITEAFLRAGGEVVICGRAAPAEPVSAAGRTAQFLACDVRDTAAVDALFAQIEQRLGGLDVLVNNAGLEEVCPSLDIDEARWDRILDTNLKGAFFCAQAAARHMPPGSAIVNVCSLLSGVGVGTAVPYGSSKTGLLGMTRGLAAEWASLGIRVNGVAPGYFRTAMTEGYFEDAAWERSMLERIPMRRFGQLDDLVGIAIFLASSASAYVTGQCLYVDGGFMASM
jgi:NAD(P)-dependent dehydrogenase (short-subunit alcohol dehydrogenase family)